MSMGACISLSDTQPDRAGNLQAMPKTRTSFKKGQSGNPAGRKQGSRNSVTIRAAELLDGEAEALTRKAIELALSGDTIALRLCLERICPPRRDRPIKVKMAHVETPQDVLQAIAKVVDAVARGAITPSEGQALASLIETQRKAIETVEIEQRLAAVERSVDPR